MLKGTGVVEPRRAVGLPEAGNMEDKIVMTVMTVMTVVKRT